MSYKLNKISKLSQFAEHFSIYLLTFRWGFQVRSRCLKVVGIPERFRSPFLTSVEIANPFAPRMSQKSMTLKEDTTQQRIYVNQNNVRLPILIHKSDS